MHLPNLPVDPVLEHFELQYNDCEWKINIGFDGSKNTNTYVYQYDGTNLTYYVTLFTSTSSNVSGTVETQPVPQMWQSAAGWIPWLAFGSQCYFGQITNGQVLSLQAVRSRKGTTKRYETPAEIILDPSPPHLPSSVRTSSALCNTCLISPVSRTVCR